MFTVSRSPEASVIARAAAGDDGAFERLVVRWDAEVLNLAYRLTGNLADAQDLRQETFVRVYRSLASFDGRSRFSTWLFRIVVNLVRDQQRRGRSADRTIRRVGEQALEHGSAPAPDEDHVRAELAARVIAAVTDLPAAEREVLVLRHYHQLTLTEVARVLDLPTTTARSRLVRALDRLQHLAPHSHAIED